MANKLLLQTDNTILRAVEPEDASFMFDVENDTTAWEYSDNVVPFSRTILKEFAQRQTVDPFSNGQLRLIIHSESEKCSVGILDLYDVSAMHRHAKIGIYITPQFRKNKYAEKALSLAREYAKFIGLKNLVAIVTSDNTASKNLFTKSGYTESGTIKNWRHSLSGFHDIIIFQMQLHND